MKPFRPVLGLLFLTVSLLGAEPLPWKVTADRVTEGTFTARAADGRTLAADASGKAKTWKLGADLKGLPRLQAPGTPLVEALWNLSLEEVLKDRISGGRLDGALSAGALWPGVWTRDASYAAHLSLAWLFPEAVQASLLAKVEAGRIIQDTGTGGSWPVSTDRVVWALAARELGRVTGDAAWVARAYPILADAAQTDRVVAFDTDQGLYKGETSFMDWREQTYPAWFQPADIADSPAVGTNALHRALYATLEAWAPALSRPDTETRTWHDRGQALARAADGAFWDPASRTYASFLYPRTAGGGRANRPDTLGNALAVLLGVAPADRAVLAADNLPLEPYGPPVIFPQLAQTGPYHNKAVWPFVTAYWGWAGKAAGRPGEAAFALEANLRAGALFLTNQENLVHDTGRPEGTSVNSERQLWSAAAQLAGILRTLVGLDLDDRGLAVEPVVPGWVRGPVTLTGLGWQGRTLSVTVSGTGTRVTQLLVNGQAVDPDRRFTPADLGPAGSQVSVEVTVGGPAVPPPPALADTTAKGPWDATSLAVSGQTDGTRLLTWKTRSNVAKSQVLENGTPVGETTGNQFALPAPGPNLRVWSVTTAGDAGWPAQRAEPVLEGTDRVAAAFADTDLGSLVGDTRTFSLTLPREGRWLVRFHYTNTSGPVSTDNKAAVRTLVADGNQAGALVFPQRGYNSNNRGWSSSQVVRLAAGAHTLDLRYGPEDRNMNGTTNQAVVDGYEAWPLDDAAP
jgi:hypothetical protein